MSLAVTLGDLDFNTGVKVDDTRWTLDLTAGWWEGPEVDLDLLATEHPGSARGRTMERHMTIVAEGTAASSSEMGHALAHRVVEALAPLHASTPLVVHELPGGRMAWVRRMAPPLVRCHGRVVQFQLSLVALDGRRYSTTTTDRSFSTTTATSLTNTGSAPAPLTVTTDGAGLTWVSVPDASAPAGIREHLAGHLPAGVVLDGMTRTARNSSGQPVPLPATWGWPAILPGTAGYSFGTVPMSITYRDTWN